MAGRGGGGGGRGGGRGGGGAGRGGGGMFATGSSFMGGISFGDVLGTTKDNKEAKLYPKTGLPDFVDPSSREAKSQEYMKEYLRDLRFSAYHVAIPEKRNASQSKFSDRYEDAAEGLPSLVDIKDRLNPEFFPKQTWANYFDKSARIVKRSRVKKDAKSLLGAAGDDEEGEGEEQDKEDKEKGSDQEEEEVDEFDDEEENPDYDNNYFDDGDNDDDDAAGGEGGEATYD